MLEFVTGHQWLLGVVLFGLFIVVLARSLQWLPKHRLAALLLAGGVFLAAAFGLCQLRLDDSPERWMPRSSVAAWERFDEHFRHSDTLVIATHFHGRVTDEDVRLIASLHDELKQLEAVNSVIDVSRFTKPVTDDSLTDILKPPPKAAADPFALYRGVLFDNPRQWRPDSLSDENALKNRTLITYIELNTGRDREEKRSSTAEENQRRRRVVRRIYEMFDERARDDVTFHLVGAIAIEHELERISRNIVRVIVPLSLLLAFLALGTAFRSPMPILVAVTAAVWSVVTLLGGIAWAGWTLNVVTVAGPTLMFVIVIATTVHFAHAASNPELALQHGSPSDGRPNGFIRWVAMPCLGAACTTGVGFLMLAFNELVPILEMGVELFYGAVLAFLGAFLAWTIIPHGKPAPAMFLEPRRMRAWHDLMMKRPKAIVAAMLVLMTSLGWAASRIELEADPFSFFHPKSKMAQTFSHIQRREFGMYLLDVALIPRRKPGEAPSSALSEEHLAAARQFQETIAARPEVRNVVSTLTIRDYQEELSKKGGLGGALSLGKTFENWLEDSANEGALRITFKIDDRGEGFDDFMREVRAQLPKEHFDSVVTGTAADVVTLGDGLIGGMVRGLITAFIVMAGVCAIWFRSLRLTLIAVLPNVFPVLFVLGVMGAFGVPLNSGSAMVATIALGVALNDTVHFVMHYRGRKQEGEGVAAPDGCAATHPSRVAAAVADTCAEIGRPIVLTSIVNCLGFSIFLLSEFRPMSDFGLLTGIAMIAALAGDLVLLPALLRVFDKDRSALAN